jgi:hypothetical protein
MLTIVEIRNEARQGITRPFVCQCDDGHEYYVKRANAGRVAQISEWIAASLAQRLGLPIPYFDIAEVPQALLDLRAPEERRDWGKGPVFASRTVPDAVELRVTDVAKIPLRLQADILLFDAWIGNDDRTLSIVGGNPKVLWSGREQQATIIDHNLAFTASLEQVRAVHVFADAAAEWDIIFHSEWPRRLADAASELPYIWSQIPDQWIEDCVGLITLEQIGERLKLFADARGPEWTIR